MSSAASSQKKSVFAPVFAGGLRQLRSDLAALGIAGAAAALFSVFDVGSVALAGDHLSRAEAQTFAAQQGLEGEATDTRLKRDWGSQELVWEVRSGDERAKLDARTGELVEMSW